MLATVSVTALLCIGQGPAERTIGVGFEDEAKVLQVGGSR